MADTRSPKEGGRNDAPPLRPAQPRPKSEPPKRVAPAETPGQLRPAP